MSKSFRAIISGTVLALAGAIAGMQGCSSGGDSGNAQQLCEDGCEKLGTCYADTGIPVSTIVSSCKTSCQARTNPGSGQTCKNANAIVSAGQACLKKSCDEFASCFEALPECEGGSTGAAGSSGAAGSPGTGGSSGGAWSCQETTDGCACVPTASTLPSTCTGTYPCCYKSMSGTTVAGCSCVAGLTTDQCSLFISSLNSSGSGVTATATTKCP